MGESGDQVRQQSGGHGRALSSGHPPYPPKLEAAGCLADRLDLADPRGQRGQLHCSKYFLHISNPKAIELASEEKLDDLEPYGGFLPLPELR